MNIMIGMINPERNWAAKLARYSSPFSASNERCTSSCRPNTLTRAWPVKASSIWALRDPVRRHWATNCRWERRITSPASTIDTGMVTRATSASVGEMANIIATTKTTVSTDVSSWLIVCCRVWDTLSMSLVTRLSSSPRGCRSK